MNSQIFLNKELAKIDSSLENAIGISAKEFTFANFSIRELLPNVSCEEVYFFESKDRDFKLLALGRSKTFLNEESINEHLKKFENDYLVFQGHFEEEKAPLIYLPEWIFVEKNNQVKLFINQSQEFNSFTNSSLFFANDFQEVENNKWTFFDESPDFDQWDEMIKKSDDLFNQNTLKKLVLARKKIFEYAFPIDKAGLFEKLYNYNQKSSHFSVFYQTDFNQAFISFTPERLFFSDNEKIETISLAGSIPRGQTPREDADLEYTLTHDERLIREQNIVTETIIENLKKYTADVEVSDLKIVKLPYIQHRAKFITAYKKEQNPLQLIKLLHPTPAVGGLPNLEAKKHILEIEKEKRHFYAGPSGILSKNESEICVGIRSAYINGSKLTVFGGAGIVKGSKAQEEWHETGTKMRPFTDVVNHTHL